MPGIALGYKGQTGGSAVKFALFPKQEGFNLECTPEMVPSFSTRLFFRRLFASLSQNHHQGSIWQLVIWVCRYQGTSWHFFSTMSDRACGYFSWRATLIITCFFMTGSNFSHNSVQWSLLKPINIHKYLPTRPLQPQVLIILHFSCLGIIE